AGLGVGLGVAELERLHVRLLEGGLRLGAADRVLEDDLVGLLLDDRPLELGAVLESDRVAERGGDEADAESEGEGQAFHGGTDSRRQPDVSTTVDPRRFPVNPARRSWSTVAGRSACVEPLSCWRSS